jgi:hypothetical protein
VALNVTVNFNTLYGLALDPTGVKLTPSNVRDRAKQIAKLVEGSIPTVHDWVELRTNLGDDTWPKGVRSIWIEPSTSEDDAFWTSPEGGAIARFTPDFLAEHIAKKEKKLNRYSQGCDEVWLLLVADGGQFSTWFDEEMSDEAFDHYYSTEFDRVFVLSGPDLGLKELQIQS